MAKYVPADSIMNPPIIAPPAPTSLNPRDQRDIPFNALAGPTMSYMYVWLQIKTIGILDPIKAVSKKITQISLKSAMTSKPKIIEQTEDTIQINTNNFLRLYLSDQTPANGPITTLGMAKTAKAKVIKTGECVISKISQAIAVLSIQFAIDEEVAAIHTNL
jgi:hypothetical protein